MPNLPYTARRVFTDAEKAIYHRIRQELAFRITEHRQKDRPWRADETFRLCALHKVLNTLRGRADCHVIKINKRGYTDIMVSAMAARILADAQLDVGQPLRCYVVVSTSQLSGKVVPTKAQLHVQAAHALCELMKCYGKHPDVTKWADTDRTLIVCQAQSIWSATRFNLGVYTTCGLYWPQVEFVDGYYGQAVGHALYPMTERQAVALGITAHPLL